MTKGHRPRASTGLVPVPCRSPRVFYFSPLFLVRLGGGLRITAGVQPNVLTIESRGASGQTLRGECIGPLGDTLAHLPVVRSQPSRAPLSNSACGVPPFDFADSLSDMDSPHEAGHKTNFQDHCDKPPHARLRSRRVHWSQ